MADRMTDREIAEQIARWHFDPDSGPDAFRTLADAITAALAAKGASLSAREPDGMETNEAEWLNLLDIAREDQPGRPNSFLERAKRDRDRLLAREAKAREEERSKLATQFDAKAAQNERNDRYWAFKIAAEMCRARSSP